MARRPPPNQHRLFTELLARLTPELQAAFIAAVEDLHAGIDWPALLDALTREDIEGAIVALNIEPAAFQAYAAVKTSALMEAGAMTVATITIPGGGMVGVRFDMSNPGAERLIRSMVGDRITGGLVPEQVQVVRDTVLAGFEKGRHPNRIATDIAGRVINGQRAGGVLGLDAPRASRLRAVTDGMRTAEGVQDLVEVRNGVPTVRYRVNRQTEARILRAYHRGEALSPADQAISARQYSNALLKARAETIARTETAQSVMGARHEAWTQVLTAKNLPPEAVIKEWRHGGHVKEPRPHHRAMSGQRVRGLDAPFEFSNGARLRFAHDPDGPASEIILCSCDTTFFLDPSWGREDV